MKINGARAIVECLKKESVDTIFCYNGGSVIRIFDELYKHGDGIKMIMPRHEQGGTHAADAYARSTGKPGVQLVTSGPGATNTITGIATAYIDSVPLVVITGQVASGIIGTDAFQEADILGITMPITKSNYLVTDIEDIPRVFKKAFYIATSGRPGPVLIDIPADLQAEVFNFIYPDKVTLPTYRPISDGHPRQIKSAVELLKKAKKPLIIAGGGVAFSGASDELIKFAETNSIPVVNTLMGHGVTPKKAELALRGIGMHGTMYGNYAIQNCDFLIAVGVRFSERITGKLEKFAANATIIHIDVDPAEIGKNILDIHPIVGRAKEVMAEFNNIQFSLDVEEWVNELSVYRNMNELVVDDSNPLRPQYVIDLCNKHFPEDSVVVSDVGQNQMWVAQYYKFTQPRTSITSGGLGTMGFSLPAAIGAAIGNPQKQVLSVSGDGGFQMNMQELAMITEYGLGNVKIIILDNNCLGMVRQWQQLLFDRRYSGSLLPANPDFIKIAEAMGIKAVKLDRAEDADRVIQELAESKTSMLVHARIANEENVLPMVPSGASLSESLTEL